MAEPLPALDIDLTALNSERVEALKANGWSSNYGKMTSSDKAKAKRAAAEKIADDAFFAAIGRACAHGAEYLAMREYFIKSRPDFGYKEDYGKLTSKDQANAKRAEAEKKAAQYTADKFNKKLAEVEGFLCAPTSF